MGIVLLCLYAAFILLVTLGVRGKNSPSSFFVNNRTGSALAVALSILVSCVGASATLGVIGQAFTMGTPAFWWLGAGAFGLTALAALLAEKVRASGAYTMPQMVENFLGKAARPLISLIIVVAWSAILAAQFTALERILASLTGLDAAVCLAVAFGLVVLHTLGGQAVIMRLDGLQTVLLLGGLAIALFWLTLQNPGWTRAVRLEAVNAQFGGKELAYYLLVVGGNYLVCPMLFGRFLSAKNQKTARLGGFYAAALLAGCSALIVCVGLACVGLVPEGAPPDAVFTTALQTLPVWLKPLVLLALVSAVVSSADTCLITAATVLSHDLLARESPASCRACVAALGCAGLGLSLTGKSILGFLLMAYDVYVCGVVVPVFIGLLCSGRAEVRPAFACAAVAVGGVCGGAAALTGRTEFSFLGMGLAALFSAAGLRRRAAQGGRATQSAL